MEYVVARDLNTLFIILDIIFLVVLGAMLWKYNKRSAFVFGLLGALIYFIVDYGIFYMMLGTREVSGANTFLFLLWLSTSYGFTNFIWIWLFLDKEKNIISWSSLIIGGWLFVALFSQLFGSSFAQISISRGVQSYHTYMLIILFVGYGYLLFHNLFRDTKYPILYLLFIRVLVQFSWELVLLISGVRPFGLKPIIINSLLETNLGLPYIFFIHMYVTSRLQVSEIPKTT